MDIGTRLGEVIRKRGLVQARVADMAGVPKETLNRIVKGATKDPRVMTLTKIAMALDLTVGWLLGEKGYELTGDERHELRRFVEMFERLLVATQPERTELEPPNASPITIGRRPPMRSPRRGKPVAVSATHWRESFGDRRDEREVDIPEQFASRGANLVFRAEGESMTGEFIADGDLLYVHEERDPRVARGKIVVCIVAGSPYVKRLDVIGNRIRLLSANERFPPMVFDEQTVEWTLVGIVLGWSHDVR